MNPEIEKAKAVMEAAQKNLSDLTENAYPRGTLVECRLGGYLVELSVCRRRGSDWANPGQMVGRNTKTGKYRTFTDADVVRVVAYFAMPSLSAASHDIGFEEINQVAWMDQHGRLHTEPPAAPHVSELVKAGEKLVSQLHRLTGEVEDKAVMAALDHWYDASLADQVRGVEL